MNNKENKLIELDENVVVDVGHTWLSAFEMIEPTDEFKMRVGEIVIRAVNRNGNKKVRMTFNKS